MADNAGFGLVLELRTSELDGKAVMMKKYSLVAVLTRSLEAVPRLILLLIILTSAVQAGVMYTYTGLPFTFNFIPGSTSVSGFLTFDNFLPPLLSLVDVTPLVTSWSFTDGADVFDASNSALFAFVSTDKT